MEDNFRHKGLRRKLVEEIADASHTSKYLSLSMGIENYKSKKKNLKKDNEEQNPE
jgi:hypothetical protein